MYNKASIKTDSVNCCPWRRNQENHKSHQFNSELKWWFFWTFKGLSTGRASHSKLNGLKRQDRHVILYMEFFKIHPKWEPRMLYCIFLKSIKALMCWAETRLNLLRGRSSYFPKNIFLEKGISSWYLFKYFVDNLMISVYSNWRLFKDQENFWFPLGFCFSYSAGNLSFLDE